MLKKKSKFDKNSVLVLPQISTKNKRLMKDSGNIRGTCKLTCFLYLLMRNNLAAGVVEGLVGEVTECKNEPIEYCNGWLAQYAEDIKKRLLGEKET